MGDSKVKSKNTPSKQDVKTIKSPAKSKNSTPSKPDSSNDKNKKTPIKTPVKSLTTTTVKSTDKKKTPVKESSIEKNTPNKDCIVQKKQSLKDLTPAKKDSINSKEVVVGKKGKREGLPYSRVRTIMKTARYAEGISPDAVQLTVIAAELFLKYLMKGVYNNATATKKKKIDYNGLASYVNSDDEEHLEFLRVLIPHKITVAEYKKLISESSKNADKLDFLVSESEDSDSESDEEVSEEESAEEEEEGDSDSDIQEIPTPQKTKASPKVMTKKSGKVETVDLGSSSEDDFIIVDQKKKAGSSSKGVIVL